MKNCIALLLFPLLAGAEPGPATNYLINEPATLLDVGMMRLETLATEFENRVGLHWTENDEMRIFRASVQPNYIPENTILMSISAMNSEPTDAQMAEGCRNAMHQMNIWLLKSLPRLFLHIEYYDPSLPSDFYTDLRDMFVIRCSFSSSRSSAQAKG